MENKGFYVGAFIKVPSSFYVKDVEGKLVCPNGHGGSMYGTRDYCPTCGSKTVLSDVEYDKRLDVRDVCFFIRY